MSIISNVSQLRPLSWAAMLRPPAIRRESSYKSALPSGTTHDEALQAQPFASERLLLRSDPDANHGHLLELCETAHLLSMRHDSFLRDTHVALNEPERLQLYNRALKAELLRRSALEASLRTMLIEHNQVVRELQATLARERAARAQAEARDAEKDTFLGILGHDLLSPLQAILTTAHLMMMRRDLGPKGLLALARVTSSGVRMQRMVEQLRDVTRNRKTSGLRVSKDEERDLASLVAKVIHEIQAASPNCSVDFDAATPCHAWVDGDRFEQVVSNLIGNAVAHGDTERPIAVALETHEDRISFSVHNYGPPIESDQLPRLFEPFKRCRSSESRHSVAGLGLGLYITDCIVRAHGGTMQVTSSPEFGTLFCAILPVR